MRGCLYDTMVTTMVIAGADEDTGVGDRGVGEETVKEVGGELTYSHDARG